MWKLAATLIFLLVFFLRFTHLGSFPAGLTKDESYYGYDAYSILQTGRDIWGESYPLIFRSTGEYKLNLTYLIVPAVKFFGLNEFAVRLPSAVFGFGTLISLFLTLVFLFKSRKLALLATAIFALSPWAFGMSRLFYESNVGLFFVAWGLYAILTGRLMFAAILLALSSYLYNPYRLIGMGILGIALLLYSKASLKSLKYLAVYLLILLPLIIATPSGALTHRLSQEWLLKSRDYTLIADDMRAKCQIHLGSAKLAKLCYPIWNKPVLHVTNVVSTALETVTPEFLFLKTDNEYIIPKQYGMYLSVFLPFYVLGLCWLFGFLTIDLDHAKGRILILASLILSTLIVSSPGSLELYRYPVSMYLIFVVITSGLAVAWSRLMSVNKYVKLFLVVCLCALALFQQIKYLATYALASPSLPLLFASDVREIYTYLADKQDYRYIVDKKFHGPITAAFFWQIEPEYFQKNIIWTDPDPWGFVNAYQLGTIHSQTYTVEQLLCEKHKKPSELIKAIVLDDPGKYAEYAALRTYDYSKTLTLHVVYDIDELYPQVLAHFPSDLCKL